MHFLSQDCVFNNFCCRFLPLKNLFNLKSHLFIFSLFWFSLLTVDSYSFELFLLLYCHLINFNTHYIIIVIISIDIFFFITSPLYYVIFLISTPSPRKMRDYNISCMIINFSTCTPLQTHFLIFLLEKSFTCWKLIVLLGRKASKVSALLYTTHN